MWVWAFSMSEIWGTLQQRLQLTLIFGNYSMHILDRVTTGMVNMVVISIFILMFDWRLGVIFILGVLCSFLIYGRMQKREKN